MYLKNKHRLKIFQLISDFVLVPTWTYQITFCIIIFSFCNFSSIPKIHGEHTTLLLLRMDSLRTCDIHAHIYIAELMHNKWVMQIALGQKGMPTNIWSQILVKFVFLYLSISFIASTNYVFNAFIFRALMFIYNIKMYIKHDFYNPQVIFNIQRPPAVPYAPFISILKILSFLAHVAIKWIPAWYLTFTIKTFDI